MIVEGRIELRESKSIPKLEIGADASNESQITSQQYMKKASNRRSCNGIDMVTFKKTRLSDHLPVTISEAMNVRQVGLFPLASSDRVRACLRSPTFAMFDREMQWWEQSSRRSTDSPWSCQYKVSV